ALDQGQVSGTRVGDDANAFALGITAAEVFAGEGGVLTGTTIDTSAAVGVVGSIRSLNAVLISQGTDSWFGLDASGLAVSLVGVPNVTLSVTEGELKANKSSGFATHNLDWSTLAANGLSLPALDIGAGTSPHVSGTVVLSAFGALVATGTLTLDKGSVSDAATVGANADALALRLSNGQVFAGTGAVLDGTT